MVTFAFIIACNVVSFVGTKTENVYGFGSGQIWLDNVQCSGTETDIDDCSHNGWGVHSCRHHGYVAISCTTGTCWSVCLQYRLTNEKQCDTCI